MDTMCRRNVLLVLLILIMLLFSGCVPGDGTYSAEHPAGFFSGIWHGWIAPILLIWRLFNANIRLYEPMNVGWWYEFAFYVAIVGGFGGFAFFRNRQ
jgi:hypothetical protein